MPLSVCGGGGGGGENFHRMTAKSNFSGDFREGRLQFCYVKCPVLSLLMGFKVVRAYLGN